MARSCLFLLVISLFGACGVSKPTAQSVPAGKLTYELVAKPVFKKFHAVYLDARKQAHTVNEASEKAVQYDIGAVPDGFVASMSATGYEAADSSAYIIISILMHGMNADTGMTLVARDTAIGPNPSLTVSYVVSRESPK